LTSGITTTPVSNLIDQARVWERRVAPFRSLETDCYTSQKELVSNSKTASHSSRLVEADGNHCKVKRKINHHEEHGDSDCFLEAAQKDSPESCDQDKRDGDSMVRGNRDGLS
jgi:hypothetical protein